MGSIFFFALWMDGCFRTLALQHDEKSDLSVSISAVGAEDDDAIICSNPLSRRVCETNSLCPLHTPEAGYAGYAQFRSPFCGSLKANFDRLSIWNSYFD